MFNCINVLRVSNDSKCDKMLTLGMYPKGAGGGWTKLGICLMGQPGVSGHTRHVAPCVRMPAGMPFPKEWVTTTCFLGESRRHLFFFNAGFDWKIRTTRYCGYMSGCYGRRGIKMPFFLIIHCQWCALPEYVRTLIAVDRSTCFCEHFVLARAACL